ncbi:MAG: hypothetical protein EU548_05170 [Promethearchaeota archaeon]|nr:MAG: hypothetical protein EU548_05170 [Candidatus Lokiarchaeota archaeon]
MNTDATNEDIKLAYRQMAKKTHPDLNKNDPNASQKFQKIKEAYNGLTQSNESRIPHKTRNTENFRTWGVLDSIFQDIFSNDFFFDMGRRKKSTIPISQPEPYVDLKELVRRKKRHQKHFSKEI